MRHLGELAVHRRRRAHHVAAEGLADRLQTETDAEQRDRGLSFLDEVETDAGFVRRAGAGESTIASGSVAITSSDETLSLRCTTTSAPARRNNGRG